MQRYAIMQGDYKSGSETVNQVQILCFSSNFFQIHSFLSDGEVVILILRKTIEGYLVTRY